MSMTLHLQWLSRYIYDSRGTYISVQYSIIICRNYWRVTYWALWRYVLILSVTFQIFVTMTALSLVSSYSSSNTCFLIPLLFLGCILCSLWPTFMTMTIGRTNNALNRSKPFIVIYKTMLSSAVLDNLWPTCDCDRCPLIILVFIRIFTIEKIPYLPSEYFSRTSRHHEVYVPNILYTNLRTKV